ncbi:MAG: hypothetical protein QOI41_1346 [Myxococcales bacterium]|nr:hypothetical protein [Myxococcales bacterium]
MNPSAASHHPSSADPYVAMHEHLILIHRGIGGAFADVLACNGSDVAGLVAAGAAAAGFLLGHHDAESLVLFPALRKSGILRSSDVGFLEGLDREHVALHEIADRLVAETRSPHPRAFEMITLAKEIATAFGLHTPGEEKGLAPERLRTMISPDDLADLAPPQWR